MAYKAHKGALMARKYSPDSHMYIGFLLPTPEAEPVIDPAKEILIDVYESTNLRKLKREITKDGKSLAKEDGVRFIPNF
jgi:hypothetical protein